MKKYEEMNAISRVAIKGVSKVEYETLDWMARHTHGNFNMLLNCLLMSACERDGKRLGYR